MEVVEFTGYTEREKLVIARNYLIPRQRTENGLSSDQIEFQDEAVAEVITGYTRESGVRQLEREIGKLARKVARKIAAKESERVIVDGRLVPAVAGPAQGASGARGAGGSDRCRHRDVLHPDRRRHHVRRSVNHARQGRAGAHRPAG